MPKTTSIKEIEILRFFETAPMEKAELLFNILSEVVRKRQHDTHPNSQEPAEPRRKRNLREPASDPQSSDPIRDPAKTPSE
jgi:hypothetical protein